jgi:hypothetical protein
MYPLLPGFLLSRHLLCMLPLTPPDCLNLSCCLPARPPCLQGDIWVDSLVSSAGDTVSVSVHDTGIGIPGEKLEDIFAPFAQVVLGVESGGLCLGGGAWYC